MNESPPRPPNLDLSFAPGPDGRTWLEGGARYPWALTRAFHDDPVPEGLATVIPQTVSSILLAGDAVAQRVTARPGAAAHVASQGAMAVHEAQGRGTARTSWRIRAEAGAYLEVVNDPVVLFPGAGLTQRTDLVAEDGATLVFADAFAWHPVAAPPAFLRYSAHLTIHDGRRRAPGRQGSDALAQERFAIGADDLHRELLASAEPLAAFGQVLVLAPPSAVLAAALSGAVADIDGAFCGVGALPNEAGYAVRIAARDTIALAAAQTACWRATRHWRWGSWPAPRRKGL